jgi:hypothetical protein
MYCTFTYVYMFLHTITHTQFFNFVDRFTATGEPLSARRIRILPMTPHADGR